MVFFYLFNIIFEHELKLKTKNDFWTQSQKYLTVSVNLLYPEPIKKFSAH